MAIELHFKMMLKLFKYHNQITKAVNAVSCSAIDPRNPSYDQQHFTMTDQKTYDEHLKLVLNDTHMTNLYFIAVRQPSYEELKIDVKILLII